LYNAPAPAVPTYLMINKAVLDQHQLELPTDLSDLRDLEQVLMAAHEIAKELNEAHKEEDDDYLFVTFMAGNSLKYITDFEFLPSGIAVHYDNSGAPVALNAFEHEKTAMMLQTMAYYFEQEIARNDNLALLNFWRGNF